MSFNSFPAIDHLISNRYPKLGEFKDTIHEGIDNYYDPNNEEGIRNAMVKTAIKVGLACVLPKHWSVGVALGAGPIAEFIQPHVERVKCPIAKAEDAFFSAMYEIPTCEEGKAALLAGLELAKQPKKLFDETVEFIGEYTLGKADQYGITQKNIENIAKVAHRLITQKAPEALKKAYKDWIENPVSAVLNPTLTVQLSSKDLRSFNTLLVAALREQDKKTSASYFSKLEAKFGHVFKDHREILGNLKEARDFFEAYRQQQEDLVKQEKWNRDIQHWNTIFSSLSQSGTHLGIPLLSKIGMLGNMGLSAANAISALSSTTPSFSLGFITPCFSLASIAIAALSFFNDDKKETNSEFNQMLIAYLSVISKQIATLRQEMHGRFDHVDRQLEAIHTTLEKSVNVISRAIHHLAVPTLISLQEMRTAIEMLYQTSNFKLDESLFREFEEIIDKIDNYTHGIIPINSIKQEEYTNTLRVLEKVILNHSSSPTFNGTVYRDMTAQGINRLLSAKDAGHILGFLGLYAEAVLNVNHPSIDVNQICNPYMWSAGVSRYLAFRKTSPSFAYDEERTKIGRLLSSGQAILKYFEFLSNQQDVFVATLEKYKSQLNKLSESIQFHGNQKLKELFKEIGYTTSQIKFMGMDLEFNYDVNRKLQCEPSRDFLKDRKALPSNGVGEPRSIERFIEAMKIPPVYIVADRLGLGELTFSYSCQTTQMPAIFNYFNVNHLLKIECSFEEKERDFFTAKIPNKFFVDALDCSFSEQMQLSLTGSLDRAWLQGKIEEASPELKKCILYRGPEPEPYLQEKVNESLLEIKKEFALSLLNQTNAPASEFHVLVNEVEAQTKLLKAFGVLTGYERALKPTFSKLWTAEKIRECLLNYSQSADTESMFVNQTLLEGLKPLKIPYLRKKIRIPNFIQQVQAQFNALLAFAIMMEQKQNLIKAMDNAIALSPQENASVDEKNVGHEALYRKDRKITKLKNEVKELKEEVRRVRKQNKQILQLLHSLSKSKETASV